MPRVAATAEKISTNKLPPLVGNWCKEKKITAKIKVEERIAFKLLTTKVLASTKGRNELYCLLA